MKLWTNFGKFREINSRNSIRSVFEILDTILESLATSRLRLKMSEIAQPPHPRGKNGFVEWRYGLFAG